MAVTLDLGLMMHDLGAAAPYARHPEALGFDERRVRSAAA